MASNVPCENQLRILFRALNQTEPDEAHQVRHRLALARFWSVREGDCILEIGCGQGETSVILATLVGPSGRVIAVDSGPTDYGSPLTLGQAHTLIKSTSIGSRIDFWTSTNLLDMHIDFTVRQFNLAVLSHSSWYMVSLSELRNVLIRCRAWAQRLGYAEWDLRPQDVNQVPHMIAVLLQARIQELHVERTLRPDMSGNVRTLVLAGDARRVAIEAGWRIASEAVLATSAPLHYCRSEISKARTMAKQTLAHANLAPATAKMISAQRRLLCDIFTPRAISLPTFALVAE